MQAKDKINKASWNHFEGAKDVVIQNITTAIRDGKIKVETATIPVLLSLIGTSLDQGYHRGASVFDREVAAVVAEASKPEPVVVPAVKKKLVGGA